MHVHEIVKGWVDVDEDEFTDYEIVDGMDMTMRFICNVQRVVEG